jgi:hypothetical protein
VANLAKPTVDTPEPITFSSIESRYCRRNTNGLMSKGLEVGLEAELKTDLVEIRVLNTQLVDLV